MSKQVMQRALDALTLTRSQLDRLWVSHHANRTDAALASADAAIAELRAEIVKPEVEPMGYVHESAHFHLSQKGGHARIHREAGDLFKVPMYFTPPDTEAMRKELERVKVERDAMAIDSECFNLWVHEAWNNPSDICRLLSGCETPDDYRAKLVPIIEARKATFAAIAAQGGGE